MRFNYKAKLIVDILPRLTIARTFKGRLIVDIAPALPASLKKVPIEVSILPQETAKQEVKIRYPFGIRLQPIPVNISDPLINVATQFISSALSLYIDQDRELKTLLNYGEDRQSVALAYRPGGVSRSIQLKLLQPVPNDVEINSSAFLSREVAKSLIDKVKIRFAPPIDATPYLRPKNTKVDANPHLGKHLKNVTLTRLSLQSGSTGTQDQYNNISLEDVIFRKWYSYDYSSAELNFDFTDYNKFIFYSSATLRLSAFREKLKRIEKLEQQRIQFVNSSFTGSVMFAGSTYVQEQTTIVSQNIEDIIRGFDRYEQYLYFTSAATVSPYSASAYYADTGYEYNVNAYWPKTGSTLYPVTSTEALEWFNVQYAIAQRFDEFNENNLVNTVPTHIREDENSDAYTTFVSMIGHFFDIIKPFIDKFPQITDRGLNPDEGLSKDLINEISEAYGFKLPTLNSVYSLSDEILGTTEEQPRRQFTAQTYKRLLHNLPFFSKAKGTRSSLNALLRTFGISPEFITIREVGAATTSSYKVFDEFSSGLDFDADTNSYIKLPFSASLREVKAIQFNCLLPVTKLNTLLSGDTNWSLHTFPHPTIETYGRLALLSGNSVAVFTDYYPIYTNDLINITLQNNNGTVSVQVMSTEGDTMVFESPKINSNTPFNSLWNNTQYLYVGGSGSAVLSPLEGTIDEFRLWGKNLSHEAVETNAYDPGSNAADEYSDAADYLFAQISFNYIEDSLLTGSAPHYVINETPYSGILNSPSLEQFEVYNITTGSFSRYSRIVKQVAPAVGAQTYVTNKIRIVPPPVFGVGSLTSNGVKKLSRTKSIVTIDQKRLQATRNEVVVSLSPTDFVNQNIIRNLGAENINNILGLPSDVYQTSDLTLKKLQEHYSQFYYAPININKFIRILSGISSVLDQTLNYFIPSKAVLFKGILIEPNILERTTTQLVKNVRVYGAGTRKTLNAAASLTGSKPDYMATFNTSQVIDLDEIRNVGGNVSNQTADIDITTDLVKLNSKYNAYNTDIDYLDTAEVAGQYNKYNGYVSQSINELLIGQVNSYTSAISQSFNINVNSSISSQTGKLKATVPSTPIKVLNSVDIASTTSSLKSTLPILVSKIEGNTSTVTSKITSSVELTVKLKSKINSITTEISSSIYEIKSSTNYYTSSLDVRNTTILGSNPTNFSTPINMELTVNNKIKYNAVNYGSTGAEPFKRLYTRKLFKNEINTNRIGGTGSVYIPALKEIKPAADLTDVGTRTFFNNPDGVYLFPIVENLPVYPKPINFQAATTWSYAQTYNIYDVVYQEISPLDATLGKLAKTSIGGNGKYYVFSTRPAYTAPADGAYYLGSIPSYIPPSLDRDNWQLLKFKPVEIREPRRIVFDTFKIPTPELNNYKTTTIAINKIIDIPDRYVDSIRLSDISSGSYVTGESTLQNTLVLFALQANTSNVRIRFYGTPTDRDADISRSTTTFPTGSHGVLLDTTINTTGVTTLTNPIPFITAGGFPPSAIIYYTVDNLTSSVKLSTTINVFYFALEIEPRIPFGYLPKHYRFYRDTGTATKRRNYEGCKNTIDTTIDGLPPVQVFISEGNELTVSPTQTNSEIITGGGGQLDVT